MNHTGVVHTGISKLGGGKGGLFVYKFHKKDNSYFAESSLRVSRSRIASMATLALKLESSFSYLSCLLSYKI